LATRDLRGVAQELAGWKHHFPKQFLKIGQIAVHFGHAPAIFEKWFAAH
jgi:hypothetical protein